VATSLDLGVELLKTIEAHDGARFDVDSDNEQAYIASVMIDCHRRNDTDELVRILRLLREKVPAAETIISLARNKIGTSLDDALRLAQPA
jgi:hypothetical protein